MNIDDDDDDDDDDDNDDDDDEYSSGVGRVMLARRRSYGQLFRVTTASLPLPPPMGSLTSQCVPSGPEGAATWWRPGWRRNLMAAVTWGRIRRLSG